MTTEIIRDSSATLLRLDARLINRHQIITPMDTKFPVEDFATSPGETLHDSIQALGMSRHELAERTGLDKKSITQIIKGIEPISQHTASALETVLRVPAHFWLNTEAAYREHCARHDAKT